MIDPGTSPRRLLIELLLGAKPLGSLSPADWSGVVDTARAANLLGSLGQVAANARISTGCNADRHLEGARLLSERQRHSVHWEAQCIHDALAGLSAPIVLLKGAAYAMAGHPNALGRLFGDIDILVPKDLIGDVELNLMIKGWAAVPSTTVYDQRYYREWMHEIPPLVHVRRGTVLDVHHTILPPTARFRPDPAKIIARSQPLPGLPFLRVPSPEDLIIHSITHLVHEGELHNGLRDLHDIHGLLTCHATDDGFWGRLAACTEEHGLREPVALGLTLVQRYFRTSIPPDTLRSLDCDTSGGDRMSLLESIYDVALRPRTGRQPTATEALSEFTLYVRAHWLRMPPSLLVRHLSRKAFAALKENRSERPPNDDRVAE